MPFSNDAACVSVWGCREGEGSGCAGGCSRRGSGGVGETKQRLFHRRRCSLSSSVVVTSSTSAEEGIGSAKRVTIRTSLQPILWSFACQSRRGAVSGYPSACSVARFSRHRWLLFGEVAVAVTLPAAMPTSSSSGAVDSFLRTAVATAESSPAASENRQTLPSYLLPGQPRFTPF
ncbi:hypothetical protein AAHA92_09813 [Salvia divinorum]|uniref:Uncharacterized protein n=1 Tax=Salvia divinorum TaxID=28513 RepID=A0ABD1HSS1_SALDI